MNKLITTLCAAVTALTMGCVKDIEVKKEHAAAGEFSCEMKTRIVNGEIEQVVTRAENGDSYVIHIYTGNSELSTIEYENLTIPEATLALYGCMKAFKEKMQ